MCGAPATSTAFTDPGWTHTALLPSSIVGNRNKRVYYVVGDDVSL
jgi:hypothetical protein